jgi:hypothetical protein
MQMQIVDLAYAANRKEQKIKKFIEINGSATYKILMLKSANHLGEKVLEEGSDMHFADTGDVVRISAVQEHSVDGNPAVPSKLAQRANSFFNFLSSGLEAEAKSSE